jgi:hypothetical protein
MHNKTEVGCSKNIEMTRKNGMKKIADREDLCSEIYLITLRSGVRARARKKVSDLKYNIHACL